MKLIVIYGLPATGKLTVSSELSILTGYRLFHNHLTVDLLLSVFDFGTPAFVELRESIWLSVIERAALSHLPGLIFTFTPEETVRPRFLDDLADVITRTQSEVHFIELLCPLNELKLRLDSPSRQQYQKLTSPELFDELHNSGSFRALAMPPPEFTIDTSLLTPSDAAHQIAARLRS